MTDNAGVRNRNRADEAGLVEAMRAAARYRLDPNRPPVLLALPFSQSWLAVNTPARRVPSHGTHFAGQTYAFDFVAVDARRRSTDVRDWRAFLATEPVERFFGFGRPILAPADGQVVAVHDGEPDLTARRSPVVALPYLLTQGSRLRRGFSALVGNHVILKLDEPGTYMLLAHLREGSVRVRPGERVSIGKPVGMCGNSGNSTQPHLHLQVMDRVDLIHARGLPVAFRDYVAWSADGPRRVEVGIPGHRDRISAAEESPAVI